MRLIINSRFCFFFFIYYFLFEIPSIQALLDRAPQNISVLGKNAASPQVAIDCFGNATAVWHRFDGQYLIIQASTKPYRGVWQPIPDNLSLSGQNALNPQIAIDSFGNAVVVWERYNGSYFVIESSTKRFGNHWQSQPDQLSGSDQTASHPQIAFDSFGQATVVWQRFNGRHTIIQSSTKSLQGTWQRKPDDLSLPGMNAKNPQIAIDQYDTATTVWQASNEFGEVIQSSIRQFQENWQIIPDILCSPAPGNAHPQIAVDPSGNVTVIWNGFNGEYGTIQASTMPYGERWQPIPDTLSLSGLNTFFPQIAIDVWGNATVVWEGFDANKVKCIQASTKQFGETWQIIPDILSSSEDHYLDPQIAIDSSGTAAVVWSNSKGFTHIFISTKPLGGSWKGLPQIISPSGGSGFKPQLAFDFLGGLIIVWTMQDSFSFIQAIDEQ